MKFSIVIPVYNVEQYLSECLQSVANQTFSDFEAICVNDGSTDSSLEIVRRFAAHNSQFSVITQKNSGLSAARNAGIRSAKGDYIVLLDSDDYIAENTLEILDKHIDNQDFIFFNGRRFYEDGTVDIPDKPVYEENINGWKYYNKYALVPRKFHFVCTVLRIYKREFLLQNNIFFKKGIFHEDNLFTPICCYYAENVKVIPDVLYFYRIRQGSITQNANLDTIARRVKDIMLIMSELTSFFGNKKIYKKIIERQNAMFVLGGFNTLCNNNLEHEIAPTLKLLTPLFKKTISDVDMKLLFSLIEKGKIKMFKKLYHLDFEIFKNYLRKIKKRIC
ncbi:MAG: glycosyltransferase [Prevotellaceae bacterium]|jgi:glycosyltransferase involved in cell wall biosynthesis|nr:glycosyltransferase [Prevotellaceae bacterium]